MFCISFKFIQSLHVPALSHSVPYNLSHLFLEQPSSHWVCSVPPRVDSGGRRLWGPLRVFLSSAAPEKWQPSPPTGPDSDPGPSSGLWEEGNAWLSLCLVVWGVTDTDT